MFLRTIPGKRENGAPCREVVEPTGRVIGWLTRIRNPGNCSRMRCAFTTSVSYSWIIQWEADDDREAEFDTFEEAKKYVKGME